MLLGKLRYSIIKPSTDSVVYYYTSSPSNFILVRLSFNTLRTGDADLRF